MKIIFTLTMVIMRLTALFIIRNGKKLLLVQRDKSIKIPEHRSSRVPDMQYKKNDPRRQLGEIGKTNFLQTEEFEVADRIVSIRLDPPVGVINMRVYAAKSLIKCDLLIHEPRLRAIMQGRRFSLRDVNSKITPNFNEIRAGVIKQAEDLINNVGNLKVTAQISKPSTLMGTDAPKPKESKPVVAKPEPSKAPPVATPAPRRADVIPKIVTPPGQVFAPKVTPGHIYEGVLKHAGHQMVSPLRGGNPYEIFQVMLVLDNGAEMPLRGAELEREITANNCHPGDRVAIRPMGKVPVTLASGEEGSKNLYQVNRIDQKEMRT